MQEPNGEDAGPLACPKCGARKFRAEYVPPLRGLRRFLGLFGPRSPDVPEYLRLTCSFCGFEFRRPVGAVGVSHEA